MGLAVALVASRAFERVTLPWLIASQTVPVIALAPMLAVVLGQYGVQGWLPKALIAAYIAFFPVAVGVAAGLRSPDPMQEDLLTTYRASGWQTFWTLRLPASVPFLFTSLKVAATAALIGSIVAEISTISFSGLGKMLAENSRASRHAGAVGDHAVRRGPGHRAGGRAGRDRKVGDAVASRTVALGRGGAPRPAGAGGSRWGSGWLRCWPPCGRSGGLPWTACRRHARR